MPFIHNKCGIKGEESLQRKRLYSNFKQTSNFQTSLYIRERERYSEYSVNFLMLSNGNLILFYRGKINVFYLKAYKWMAEILPTLGGAIKR